MARLSVSSGMRQWTDSAEAHGGIAGFALPEDEGRVLTARLRHERLAEDAVRYEIRLHSNVSDSEATVVFDVRSPFPLEVPHTADAALLVALFPALHHGGELRIEGDVSRCLARNVLDLQAIWFRARPDRYRPFRARYDGIVDALPAPESTSAVMPLSGGVDSLLTLCRHTDSARPLGPATVEIGACLFLPGFSPRQDRRAEFPAATARVRALAAERDLPLIVAESNFSDVVRWGVDAHGAHLAAATTLFSRHFSTGLVASTLAHSHPHLPYFGAAPQITPLYSSSGFELREDGGDMRRIHKVAALGAYPDMLPRLVVCFEVPGLTGNCGRCEKCVRTILSFLALGEALPASLPQPVDPKRIGQHLGRHRRLFPAEDALEIAASLDVDGPELRKFRRRVRVKRLKYGARYALTWLVPGLNLLRRDSTPPGWLVRRKARAAAPADRGVSWQVAP